MAQNGKPCETYIMNNRAPLASAKSSHRDLGARSGEGRPVPPSPAAGFPDYVGSDRFVVAFGPDSIETVEVEVVPSTEQPDRQQTWVRQRRDAESISQRRQIGSYPGSGLADNRLDLGRRLAVLPIPVVHAQFWATSNHRTRGPLA